MAKIVHKRYSGPTGMKRWTGDPKIRSSKAIAAAKVKERRLAEKASGGPTRAKRVPLTPHDAGYRAFRTHLTFADVRAELGGLRDEPGPLGSWGEYDGKYLRRVSRAVVLGTWREMKERLYLEFLKEDALDREYQDLLAEARQLGGDDLVREVAEVALSAGLREAGIVVDQIERLAREGEDAPF